MKTLALICGIIMPLWNIPLIVRICKRRSSGDISLAWAVGVWVCVVGTFPWALRTEDIVFKAYSIMNIILFSGVVLATLHYHPKNPLLKRP